MKTPNDILIEDLEKILEEVKNKEFTDFENEKYDMPKVELVKQLQEIIEKVKNGTYDN